MITIRYSTVPTRRTLATGQVMDCFGLAPEESPHVIAENLQLDIRPTDLVLFTGPSGSGKSSLLRAVSQQQGAVNVDSFTLPDCPLIEVLSGTIEERMNRLSACGLSEARLMLRTPGELSDGQRFRFRLAYAFERATSCSHLVACNSSLPPMIAVDEFAANLDRTTAKVLAFNLRKQVTRSRIGVLAATTHRDLEADLRPDLTVHCHGGGHFTIRRLDEVPEALDSRLALPRTPLFSADDLTPRISFANDLWVTEGSHSDWQQFAGWHYRSHHLAFVKKIVLLCHGEEPIGICVFSTPAASLSLRTQYFGLHHPRSRLALQALNQQMWLLSRLVLNPIYRGAGLGAAFVRRACASCPVPWIETLSAMGQVNPIFERAGFVRVGVIARSKKRSHHSGGQYANRRVRLSAETTMKSRYSEPVYLVRDNQKLMIDD